MSSQVRHMTVVTNSIHHAIQLVEKQHSNSHYRRGGQKPTDASIGGVALNQIGQLHFQPCLYWYEWSR